MSELPLDFLRVSLSQIQNPIPGDPSRHLLLDATTASNGVLDVSSGRTPNELIASISRDRRCSAVTFATVSIGFKMPDVVSQWTTATWVIAGSAASCRPSSSVSTGRSSVVSSIVYARSCIEQISTIRLPYAPLTSNNTFPDRGMSVISIASTTKVPLP